MIECPNEGRGQRLRTILSAESDRLTRLRTDDLTKYRKIIKDKKKEWNHQTLFSKVIAEIKALQNLNQRNANAHAEDEEDMDN